MAGDKGSIFELTDQKLSVLHQSCSQRQWGVASSPNTNEFVTCGDDKTIRVWDFETHIMKTSI